MELDPKLKEILDSLDPSGEEPVEEMTPVRAREIWKAEMAAVAGKPLAVARIEAREFEGPGGPLAARIYHPEVGASALPVLSYIHGGGWIRGDLDTHDDICRFLCHHAGCIVAAIDYRPAPECHFPGPVHDALAGVRWVAENAAAWGGDPARLAIGGDSAGGNLACAVTHLARDGGGPTLMFQLLIYPVTDLASETKSKRLYSSGYLLDSMPFYIASYLGPKGDALDPLASPLRATDLTRLPPAFVLTAGFDPLRDEGDAYAKRLAEAGVAVQHKCYENMIHGFASITGLIESAEAGLYDSAAALREVFNT
ncbi:MAG: alpha/beta hydrolase [Proteobacteria bacterium]|nr:alpha/beta hydrolase [Pseudomonadota bacterium]MDA1355816.1 alpha/beta hydrolase [Pseudomonadota bacterium]